MKTKLLLLFTFLITSFSNAQFSNFITGLDIEPNRLIIDENIIYAKGIATPGKILQIDLSNNTPTASVLFNSLPNNDIPFEIGNIIKQGDFFYLSYINANSGESTLASFNINNPTVLNDIVSNLGFVNSLELYNNELYFTEESLTPGDNSLKKIDITVENPTVNTVITGLNNPQDIEFKDNILYISDKNTIYSIDVLSPLPTLNPFVENVNVRGIYVYDEFLYFSDGGTIKKVLFSDPLNIFTETDSNQFVRDVVIYNNTLYMPVEEENKIVQHPISNFEEENTLTNLTEIANGLNSPNDLTIINNILYVATEDQILSYDITVTNPTPTIIFTTPSATANTLEVVSFFNILNGVLFVVSEKIDLIEEKFLESKVNRVPLSNPSNTTVIETVPNYVSAATFNGSLLYRVEEDQINDISNIMVRDVAIPGSTFTTIASFNGIVLDIDTYKNLVLISNRSNSIFAINIDDATPTAQSLLLGENINSSLGIQVLDDSEELFITSSNKIYEGFLFDENANLGIFPIIENTIYTDGGNNTSFSDIFIYKGVGYMTIAESGVVVKTDPIETNLDCPNSELSITDFVTNLDSPEQIIKKDNDIYMIEPLAGISKIDITTKAKTTVYTALRNGNNYEFLNDFIINNNILYFTSRTIDVTNFNYVSSSVKKLDLSTSTLSTLLTSTLENEFIQDIDINGNNIVYSITDNTDEEFPTSSISLYNTTTNLVTNTGLNLNFFLDDFIIDGNDIYFVQNGIGSILKGDLTNLSNPTSIFLNNDNSDFIEHLSLNNGLLYFSNQHTIKRVALNSANPNTGIETIAINGSITNPSNYNTTSCSSFNGVLVDENLVYTSMPDANRIVTINNQSLSINSIIKSKDLFLKISENTLQFNNLKKPITVNIYTITGKNILSFKANNIENTINIKHLLSGIYFIKLSNGSSHKFIK